MKYRVTDIENFVATQTCSTIIQAAKKLEISQPALSESIKRLEHDAGFILFYRSRSGIKLTPNGKTFLLKAKAVLEAVEGLSSSSSMAGSVSIGCHPTVAQYSLPQTIKLLSQTVPNYRLELRHDLSRNIQLEVQRGNIDIGIIINPAQVPDLVIQRLCSDTVAVWAAKNISTYDTIFCNPDLFQTQSILKKWKNKPARIISTDSLELLCRLVNENIGYGIIPERAVLLSGFSLKLLSLPTFRDEVCLVFRPEFGKTPSEKLILEAVRKAFV